MHARAEDEETLAAADTLPRMRKASEQKSIWSTPTKVAIVLGAGHGLLAACSAPPVEATLVIVAAAQAAVATFVIAFFATVVLLTYARVMRL